MFPPDSSSSSVFCVGFFVFGVSFFFSGVSFCFFRKRPKGVMGFAYV